MHILNLSFVTLIVSILFALPAQSEESSINSDQSHYSTIVSTNLFSQTLVHALPKGWRLAGSGEKDHPEGLMYSQSYVLEGQTATSWTELITVTGFKNMAKVPNASSYGLINKIAAQKKSVCPDNSVAISGGDVAFGSVRGHVAMMGCGKLPIDMIGIKAGEGEIGVYIVLQGVNDMYIIQRVRHTESFEPQSPPITPQIFGELLKSFFPIGICELNDSPDQCRPKLGGNK